MTEKPQVKAYVEQEIYDKIKTIAKKNKRSISNQIEILLEQYIDNYEKEHGSITINMRDNNGTINL